MSIYFVKKDYIKMGNVAESRVKIDKLKNLNIQLNDTKQEKFSECKPNSNAKKRYNIFIHMI
ncbi:hypothetical protein BpHYR1_013546 [Brachionus plicatilis]|uniref:Uncharacterized protein n=1 Tax=Brachionus plicatilis TaxID=10195 RepID=A0A3M7SDU2_BRAPC|nr:hypothetical protein BpHYR1_013546 [Brachionus plicatilis]